MSDPHTPAPRDPAKGNGASPSSYPLLGPPDNPRSVQAERQVLGRRPTARNFPDWITAYCRAVEHSEAPEKFHFWTAVSTLAGALRRHVWIDQSIFKLYPNFFIVFVGEPGIVTKSTAIGGGLKLLREIGANVGPSVATWQGFLKRLEQSIEGFSIGDATTPLADRKHVSTCAVTMHVTEWGTFIDPRDHLMVNMLTDLWDCKDGIALDKTTATQGDTTIVNPFVNMLAATTPKWMYDNIRGQFGGWGLSSRIIFVFAARPRCVIAFPGAATQAESRDGVMRSLAGDLRRISELNGAFRISDEVLAYGQTYREELSERQIALATEPDSNPWLRYFLARKFDYILKLGMVLSVSRSSSLVLELDDFIGASARMDEVEHELLEIFGRNDPDELSRSVRTNHTAWNHLRHCLESEGPQPRHIIHRFLTRYMTFREAEALIEQLCASQLISQFQDASGLWLTLVPPT
jgi:hypothetical protein